MRKKRIFAFVIDLLVVTIASQILLNVSLIKEEYLFLLNISLIVSMLFCKDIVNGQSIGKFFMKIQVVKNFSMKEPSSYSCVIRNLFLCFFPIEIFFLLKEGDKRFGDLFVGTKVIYVATKQSIRLKVKYFISFIVVFILVYPSVVCFFDAYRRLHPLLVIVINLFLALPSVLVDLLFN